MTPARAIARAGRRAERLGHRLGAWVHQLRWSATNCEACGRLVVVRFPGLSTTESSALRSPCQRTMWRRRSWLARVFGGRR